MNSRKIAVLIAGLSTVFAGIVAYSAVSNVLAVGTLPDSEIIDGSATVTVRQLIWAPGEVGGWHHHPGASVNVVKRGTLTIEDGCGGEDVYVAGQAFEEGGSRAHRGKNLGTEEAEVFNAYVTPEGSPFSVSLPERLCGPPRSTKECRHHGWTDFTHPRRFTSQRDCVRFVRRGDDD